MRTRVADGEGGIQMWSVTAITVNKQPQIA